MIPAGIAQKIAESVQTILPCRAARQAGINPFGHKI
jgi:hypothetical protein